MAFMVASTGPFPEEIASCMVSLISNFTIAVGINGSPHITCNSFTVISNTQLEARVGNGNSGNVTVVSANGSNSKPGFIFGTSIGINQQGNSNALLKAYPNPANNNIQIQIPISTTNSKIAIYNLLGEEIFSHEIAAQTNAIFINLNDWKAGSYIIRWNDQSTTLSSSFLKSN